MKEDNNIDPASNAQVEDYSKENEGQAVDEIAYAVEGGNIYFDSSTGTITRADRSITKADIPATISNQAVTTIGYQAFANCSQLKEVTLPNSVTQISEGAFGRCSSLEKVTLSDSLELIDKMAFYECMSLETIAIPDSVTTIGEATFVKCTNLKEVKLPNDLQIIEDGVFNNCSNLQTITLPNNLQEIGYAAFENCSSLEAITIPDSVTAIGEIAFNFCTNLKSVTLPNNITTLEECVFQGCESLEDIAIPESVTTICEGAFNLCNSLTKVIVPDSVTTLGKCVFGECNNLREVVLSNNLKEIDEGIFYMCYVLEKVVLPEGITTIKKDTFYDCKNLKEVTIPKSVTTIEDYAFANCYSLNNIYYSGTQEEWNQINIVDKEGSNSILLETSVNNNTPEKPVEKRIAYKVEGGNIYFDASTGTIVGSDRSITKAIIPDTIDGHAVKTIGEDAFNFGCKQLTEVTIPNGVTKIEKGAFGGCSNLEKITLPDSVKEFGEGLFMNCVNLKEVTLPNSLTTITPGTFLNCKNLKEVTIPKSVTTIEKSAFENCYALNNIQYNGSQEEWNQINIVDKEGSNNILVKIPVNNTTTPENPNTPEKPVENIAYKVEGGNIYFEPSTGTIVSADKTITSVTIPHSIAGRTVKEIGAYAFADCTQLKEVTMSSGIHKIGKEAFGMCTSLEKIELPFDLNFIDEVAFDGCSSLIEITIPNNVTEIGRGIFAGCTNLKSVTLSNQLITLPWETFYNCTSLESVIIPKMVTTLEQGLFRGCTSLKEVTLPHSVTTIKESLFDQCTNLNTVYYNGNQEEWDQVNIADKEGSNSLLMEKVMMNRIAYKVEGGNIYFEPSTGTILYGDKSITKAIIPDKIDGHVVTTIGDWAFDECINLKEITIPDSVTTFGEGVFFDCEQLKDVTLPKGLTELAIRLFQNCVSLEELTLPETVTKIGLHALKFDAELVPSLKTIYYDGDWDKVIKEDQDCDILDKVEIRPTSQRPTQPDDSTPEKPTPDQPEKPADKPTSSNKTSSTPSNNYTRNTINVTAGEGGTVKSNTKRVTKDTTVTLTVEPNVGYTLDTLTVTDAEGNALTVTNKDTNLYQFTMPNSAVEVNATFKGQAVQGEKVLAQQTTGLPFTDIANDASYKDAVQYVYNRGLMTGDGNDTTFNPDGTMTRAMIVTVLYRLEGKPTTQPATFNDVSPNQWYHDAIAWAAENNIVAGHNEQTFAPKDAITLEHLVAILSRYEEFKGQTVSTEGLIDETVNPKDNATRAQVATALSRFNI